MKVKQVNNANSHVSEDLPTSMLETKEGSGIIQETYGR